MKKIFWLSILIVIFAALFASTHPDGLDWVSEKLGFAQRAVDGSAILAGYALPFFPAGAFSTAAAGMIGVILTGGLFYLSARLLRRSKSD